MVLLRRYLFSLSLSLQSSTKACRGLCGRDVARATGGFDLQARNRARYYATREVKK